MRTASLTSYVSALAVAGVMFLRPAAVEAQSSISATLPVPMLVRLDSTTAALSPLPVSSRDILGLSRTFTVPSQLEPYGVVDQNNVRRTQYKDPMHCSMAGLLTPLQMEAAQQACSDTFYHVDHSG
jgi:hypothetical protein